MKYFSINYLGKTFLLSLPIFANQKKEANSKPIFKNTEFINIYNDAKNVLCIHEAGHAINVLKSDSKHFFEKLEIGIAFNNETSIMWEGKTSSTHHYTTRSIKELESIIRINMAGKAAEELYNIENDEYVELPEIKLIDELKKRFSESSNDNHIRISEENLNNIVNNSIFIEKNNAKKIIINNQIEFNKIVETCNLLEYVTKSHTDYILKHKEIPPEAKEREKKLLQEMTNEIINSTELSTQKTTLSQFEEIPPEAKLGLKELRFIQSLSISEIQALTPEQIQALTKPQIHYLSIYDFGTDEQKSGLTPEQIPEIIFNSVFCKTPNEISNIPVEDIEDIELVEIMLLTKPQIEALTEEQIEALTEEQKSGLTTTSTFSRKKRSVQLSDNSPSISSLLTAKSISGLTKKQIAALTLHQIRSWNPQQLATLSPDQIEALTEDQIEALDLNCNELPTKVMYLLKKQIQTTLPTKQLKGISNISSIFLGVIFNTVAGVVYVLYKKQAMSKRQKLEESSLTDVLLVSQSQDGMNDSLEQHQQRKSEIDYLLPVDSINAMSLETNNSLNTKAPQL